MKKTLQHAEREKEAEKPAFPRARDNTNRRSDVYLHDVAVEFTRGATIPLGSTGQLKIFFAMRRWIQSEPDN